MKPALRYRNTVIRPLRVPVLLALALALVSLTPASCRRETSPRETAAGAGVDAGVIQQEPEPAALPPEPPPGVVETAPARPVRPAVASASVSPSRSLKEFSGKLPPFGVSITEVNPLNYQNADPAVLRQMGVEQHFISFLSAGKKYRAGDWDGAIADYSQALKHKGDFTEALESRGNAWLKKGETGRAVDDYSQALLYRSDRAEVYNYRGYAYASLGDNDRAIADFSKAIAINPHYALAFHNRGTAWYNKGDIDKAHSDLSQAIALDPSFSISSE